LLLSFQNINHYQQKTSNAQIIWELRFSGLLRSDSRNFLANNQLDALFNVFIYFTSIHVSSSTVLIIRRSILLIHHLVWLVCVSDC
jgi:hypothetical protein